MLKGWATVLGAVLAASLAAAQSEPSPTPPAPSSATTAMSRFSGLKVHQVELQVTVPAQAEQLRSTITLKVGDTLDRDRIQSSVHALYATGRFADIEVHAERTAAGEVDVRFVTMPNFFVGSRDAEGMPGRLTANQVVNASKFQLGELYTPEKLGRGLKNIQRLLEESGFYKSTVQLQEMRWAERQQIDLLFHIEPGPQAVVGAINITGKPESSKGQIEDTARLHPGDPASTARVTRGLQRIQKGYQKQNRLLAQVSVAKREYRPQQNAVDYTLAIEPGLPVEIITEGFKIGQGALKALVPIYEEGALDDDLLNEGRRNILAYVQNRGYFDATVELQQHPSQSNKAFRVIYLIAPGIRHKLSRIVITGNKYFSEELLEARLQIQPASAKLLSKGRYSQRLLAGDVGYLEDLYRSNGFREVKVQTQVEDNYQGKEDQLSVHITVVEGAQTLVGTLKIAGESALTESELTPLLSTAADQPFSEGNLTTDRDVVLNYYFNHGFPHATFEASISAEKDHRIDVGYAIQEGEKFSVNQVLLSGLNHTRPGVVRQQILVKSGAPLSQQDMLDSQRNLYNLGIFNQVSTGVQNPDGTEPQKNVLVDVNEAKRYTFDYGVGLEFQSGQPSNGVSLPAGKRGVNPRISFGVTRNNLFGSNQTLTFKTNIGSLQQRGLLSYDAPRLFSRNIRISFTAFYDNTLDVTTFTSRRLEGSVQATQPFNKTTTMIYRFTYRQVQASNINVSADQIPLLSQPTRVGFPGFTFIRNRRDNDIETTHGNYTTVDGSVASHFFGSEADFGRILIQNSTYYSLGKKRAPGRRVVFARSTRIGIENPLGNTVIVQPGGAIPLGHSLIPLPERFYTGGGNSHRGFGLNQAGPRDPSTGFPIGGASLFLNNLELRFPAPTLPIVKEDISFAVFHDMGNVFTRPQDLLPSFVRWRQSNPDLCLHENTKNQCNYNYLSHAIGLGVRYKTPIGPLRFDLSYNLNPPAFPGGILTTNTINNVTTGRFVPEHAAHFNVFFSIGQAF